jgi:hypothetical protein
MLFGHMTSAHEAPQAPRATNRLSKLPYFNPVPTAAKVFTNEQVSVLIGESRYRSTAEGGNKQLMKMRRFGSV